MVSAAINRADELLVPRTISPDGKYGVYAVDSNEKYLPATLEIRSLSDQKSTQRLDVGGWVGTAALYAAADEYGDEDADSIFVIWNGRSSGLAMMIRDGRRSGSLVVCEKKDSSFTELILPDYEAFVEAALGLKRDGRYVYEFPEAWIDDHRLSIKLRFDDVDLADSKTYQFECTLEYDFASHKTSNLKVLSKTLEEG